MLSGIAFLVSGTNGVQPGSSELTSLAVGQAKWGMSAFLLAGREKGLKRAPDLDFLIFLEACECCPGRCYLFLACVYLPPGGTAYLWDSFSREGVIRWSRLSWFLGLTFLVNPGMTCLVIWS